MRSVPQNSSEADCVAVKKTILENWLQTGFAFESVLSFEESEITGVWSNYRIPLIIHHWRECYNISNHCERDFISDFSKRSVLL